MRAILPVVCMAVIGCAAPKRPVAWKQATGQFCRGDCPPWDRFSYSISVPNEFTLQASSDKDVLIGPDADRVEIEPVLPESLARDNWSNYWSVENILAETQAWQCPGHSHSDVHDEHDDWRLCDENQRWELQRVMWTSRGGFACHAYFRHMRDFSRSIAICASISAQIGAAEQPKRRLQPAKTRRATLSSAAGAIEFELMLPALAFELPEPDPRGGRWYSGRIGDPIISVRAVSRSAVAEHDTTTERGDFVEIKRAIRVGQTVVECQVEIEDGPNVDDVMVRDGVSVCNSLTARTYE